MSKKILTQELALEHLRNKHNNTYDYSKMIYTCSRAKIEIICQQHGSFWQRYSHHADGNGCPVCGKIKADKKQRLCDLPTLINNLKDIHQNKYDYSLIKEYKNVDQKIPIICSKHGVFYQKLYDHLTGHNCYQCCPTYQSNTLEFIKKANIIHSNIYDYSETNYINSYTDVTIICSRHGKFKQRPANHLSSHGCPVCKSSRGEKLIYKILKDNNIVFQRQKIFPDCKYKDSLKFDFYIPDKNVLIEFDGLQHFGIYELYGGEREFLLTQIRDEIKNKYAEANNITLIRIPYWFPYEDVKEILLNDINTAMGGFKA